MIHSSHLTFLILIGTEWGHGKTVDLTHTFDDVTVYWPTAHKYKFKLEDAGSSGSYKAYKFCTAEHGGTHMDSPIHFVLNRDTTHEVPLDKLIGNAFIVDVSNDAKNNRDLLINVDHLKKAEESQKTNMNNKIVLLYTGYSHHWPNLDKYLGTNTTDPSLLHFPGLHPNAAHWIVNNRNIKSIGIDTASIDRGQSKDFQSHVTLFKANIPAFENVDLKEIDLFRSKDDTMIYALPMKIKGGSGGPLRIIAVYDTPTKSSILKVNADNVFTFITVFIVIATQYIWW